MRHRNSGRKLGLTKDHRKAMLRQLTEALFLHGRIRTTVTRAKEVRPIAERIVTWAKKGTLHHRRLAFAVIYRQDIVNRIFDHVVEWYRNRQGGYTRIIKIGPRPGDSAPMGFLELVDWIPGERLVGQLVKQVKKPQGEEGAEGKEEKGKKEKAKKEKVKKEKAEKKAAPKPEKKSAAKDPEKEKKKAERRAAQEKLRQERAVVREKTKKEKAGQKVSVKAKTKTDKGGPKQK